MNVSWHGDPCSGILHLFGQDFREHYCDTQHHNTAPYCALDGETLLKVFVAAQIFLEASGPLHVALGIPCRVPSRRKSHAKDHP